MQIILAELPTEVLGSRRCEPPLAFSACAEAVAGYIGRSLGRVGFTAAHRDKVADPERGAAEEPPRSATHLDTDALAQPPGMGPRRPHDRSPVSRRVPWRAVDALREEAPSGRGVAQPELGERIHHE